MTRFFLVLYALLIPSLGNCYGTNPDPVKHSFLQLLRVDRMNDTFSLKLLTAGFLSQDCANPRPVFQFSDLGWISQGHYEVNLTHKWDCLNAREYSIRIAFKDVVPLDCERVTIHFGGQAIQVNRWFP